jgi:hypothetical protein
VTTTFGSVILDPNHEQIGLMIGRTSLELGVIAFVRRQRPARAIQ